MKAAQWPENGNGCTMTMACAKKQPSGGVL